MSLAGAIMGNFWFVKEEISDNIFPKKSQEKREKIRQSEGYKNAMRFFDLIGTKDINYLTALGENLDSAYICTDISDKARKAGIPLASSAMKDLVETTGYTESEIAYAIQNKTLVEFLKGKGVSEEAAKRVGEISRELYDETNNVMNDIKMVSNKLNISENEVNFVAGLLNEFKTIYGSMAKPFTVEGVDDQKNHQQQKQSSKRSNKSQNSQQQSVVQ